LHEFVYLQRSTKRKMKKYVLVCLLIVSGFNPFAFGQLVINEGSNKNYSILADEDGEFDDWIEIYNAGSTPVDLFNYSLSDNDDEPGMWAFPHDILAPGEFRIVYCSEKNRLATAPFTNVMLDQGFIPQIGWNDHNFTTPFVWDGFSNIVLNVCSYVSAGYTENSIFKLNQTDFNSSIFNFVDGSDASCSFNTGQISNVRPNIRINGIALGEGDLQNETTSYPAPYGNWYFSARNQFLFKASELIEAGINPGNIESIAFEVLSTNPTQYDYIFLSLNNVGIDEFSGNFMNEMGYQYHSNFKINTNGENVYLFSPENNLVSQLNVDAQAMDLSIGRLPNGSNNIGLFLNPSPNATNNGNQQYSEFALPPVFSVNSGVFQNIVNLSIFNANSGTSQIRYTLDGSDPTISSELYDGNVIQIFQTAVIKARCFKTGFLPSEIKSASYLIGISHTTPILSLVTDVDNLYGPNGNFTNFNNDWLKSAHVQYFDETPEHNLIFSQATGMIQDGGAGGSRSHPQHSFRLELDHGTVGGNAVNYPLIPNKSERTEFSKIYLRNGSNQYQVLPHKDAMQVEMMCAPTNNYHSGWRPVSVYINGGYFGLYELREKFDSQFFEVYDNADPASVEILSLSFFYGSILRAVEGSVDSYYDSYENWSNISISNPNYIEQMNSYFDVNYYIDYIIGETWMGNADWPQNNIKIYRSNATNNAWRFCIQDLELSLNPNGWTDCYHGAIERLINESPNNIFTNIWLNSMENDRFHDLFINRYADLMNSAYLNDSLISIADEFFEETIIEMPRQFARWGDPNNVNGQMNDFINNNELFKDDLLCRTEQVRNEIENIYNLPKQVDLELDVFPAGAGKIRINSIVPESYPWEGIYFDGIPVKLTAIANEGFIFSNWNENSIINNTLNPVINDTLEFLTNSFTAFFTPDETGISNLVSNDLFISPNPAQQFIHVALKNTPKFKSSFQIIDLEGKIIHEGIWESGVQKMNIDLGQVSKGIYVLRVTDGINHSFTKRFVKN
jgi:hypothetical protein